MKKYVCDVCGYIYDEETGDPENGIEPGTKWEDVPDDFVCPLCGVGKDEFSEAQFQLFARTVILYAKRTAICIGWQFFLYRENFIS